MKHERNVIDVPAPAATTTYAAGYIRLTREESLETGLSSPGQRKGITDYWEKHGSSVPLKIFEETTGVGGDYPWSKRPAGSKLMAAILAGEVSHVIVRDLDRLTRDVRLALELSDICRTHNVTLHTFSAAVSLKSASDLFAYTVRAAASQFEKDQTGDRLRQAKRELVEQGRWGGGPPPYGYQSQARRYGELVKSGMEEIEAKRQAVLEYPLAGHLYVYPIEAEVIRLIYQYYLHDGHGARRVANDLNQLGHRTRTGGYWSNERLRRTLTSPAAAGYLVYDESAAKGLKPTFKADLKLHKGLHEAIIPLESWQKAMAVRRENTWPGERRGNPSLAWRKYPLSGVLRCECGAVMRGKSRRKGQKSGRYTCVKLFYHGRTAINGCSCAARNLDSFDIHEVFWTGLKSLLNSEDLVNRVYTATQRLMRDRKSRTAAVRDFAGRLTKLSSQITTWYTRHDTAQSDAAREAAWNRIVELTEQKRALQGIQSEVGVADERTTRITREEIAKYLASMGKLLDEHGGDGAKTYVRSLVQHHGLRVQMVGPETMRISLAIRTPGSQHGNPVECEVKVAQPRNKVGAWLACEQGKHVCPLCSKPVTVARRHYSKGVPTWHRACWCRERGRRRRHRDDGYISGQELARRLKKGRTTIGRWLKSGRLPPPTKREGGILLWPESVAKLTSLNSTRSP